jgi:prepilin-type processing-associated H-X9-DG protein
MDKSSVEFQSPSQLIIIAPHLTGAADETASWQGTSANNPELNYPPGAQPQGTHANAKNINALFADAHVENLAWQKYSDSTSDAGKQRWLPQGTEAP